MKTLKEKESKITLQVYESHHVSNAVNRFKIFLKDFGKLDKKRLEDMGIFKRYEEIFGDFEKWK